MRSGWNIGMLDKLGAGWDVYNHAVHDFVIFESKLVDGLKIRVDAPRSGSAMMYGSVNVRLHDAEDNPVVSFYESMKELEDVPVELVRLLTKDWRPEVLAYHLSQD